jgi:branched-chain amino acid transport system permease protein
LNWAFIAEQMLNGVQFGMMLFLLAAGLTLVFGVMDFVNLAHGSLYMVGAFAAAAVAKQTGSFVVAVSAAVVVTALVAMVLEKSLLRRIYGRDPMIQVLATFALILMFNDGIRMLFGAQALNINLPPAVSGPLQLLPGLNYSAYRLVIIAVGACIAILLYLVLAKTRLGMRIRAGADNRTMATVMGADVNMTYTLVFGAGGALCGIAGAMLAPLLAVQIGMGEGILILCFVVVVIGGIGSVRGAFAGALIVGVVDTLGRTLLPALVGAAGASLSSMLIYIVMIGVLIWRPEGLYGVSRG